MFIFVFFQRKIVSVCMWKLCWGFSLKYPVNISHIIWIRTFLIYQQPKRKLTLFILSLKSYFLACLIMMIINQKCQPVGIFSLYHTFVFQVLFSDIVTYICLLSLHFFSFLKILWLPKQNKLRLFFFDITGSKPPWSNRNLQRWNWRKHD